MSKQRKKYHFGCENPNCKDFTLTEKWLVNDEDLLTMLSRPKCQTCNDLLIVIGKTDK